MAEGKGRYWQSRRNQYCGGETSSQNAANSRPRHPPHLRGREIGLYYANLNREKRLRENLLTDGNREDGNRQEYGPGYIPLLDSDPTGLPPGQPPVKRIASACSGKNRNVGCGQYHKQKDYQLPVIPHSGDIEKTLSNLGNAVFPSASETFDKCGPKPFQPVVNLQKVDCNRVAVYSGNGNNSGLVQNEEIDRQLCHNQCGRSSSSYLQVFRTKLPAYNMQGEILNAIEENQVVIVMGETGCGKTTQVPQFILDSFISAGRGSLCKVVCTQPRRISAITVAERVAQERNVPCGQQSEVGYQIRLESEMPADQGSILFCTTGIVLQWLQENPLLNGVTHVVVDEVHERDLLGDFLLIILKDLLKVRSDIKVILMSATLNQENFSVYFGGCPTIQIPGLTYPVDVFMLEDIIETIGYVPEDQGSKRRRRMSKLQKLQVALESKEKFDYLCSLSGRYSQQTVGVLESWNEDDIDLNLVVSLIKHISRHEKEGAVLVFLPGWEQISKLRTLMMHDGFLCANSLIVPLHSLMPTINQKEAFEKPPRGKRKIVIATNIAETSITIDDVVFVIDAGKIKMQNFDHYHDISTLKPEWVAKSNAKQRKGRAGRTQKGLCFRLFTRFREERLHDYQLPEMLRVRLEEMILKVKLLKLGFAQEFLQKALDPPPEVMIAKSVELLKKLEALDEEESLTPLGYHLAQLPMAPQLGKMCILGAVFSCLDPVLSIAASLSFREPFMIPLGQERQVDEMKKEIAGATHSDHVLLCHIIKEYETAVEHGYGPSYCYDHYLSKNTLKMLVGLKVQLAEHLCSLKFICSCDPKNPDYNRYSDDISVLKAVICAGLYPNCAVLRGKRKPHNKHVPLKAMDNSRGAVHFHPKSVNSVGSADLPSKLLVYFLKVKSSQNFVHDSTFVNCFPLALFGHDIKLCDYYGFETLCVDNWLHLQCSANTSTLIKTVCERVKAFLLWKFSSTSKRCESTWLTREKYFIEQIIKLINLEDDVATNS